MISDIAHGDVAALGELFDRYGQRCWAIAGTLTSDAELAAAVVEAAFLDLWRQPPQPIAVEVGDHLGLLIHRNMDQGTAHGGAGCPTPGVVS